MQAAFRIGLVTALTVFAMASHAQAPTTAQRNAIRQSCAADYQSACAGVPTGGAQALQCLQQHASALSPDCQSAVAAVSSGGKQQAASRPAAAPGRPAEACRSDFAMLCGGIRPGGGRALMCLRQHGSELSPGCQESLAALRR